MSYIKGAVNVGDIFSMFCSDALENLFIVIAISHDSVHAVFPFDRNHKKIFSISSIIHVDRRLL